MFTVVRGGGFPFDLFLERIAVGRLRRSGRAKSVGIVLFQRCTPIELTIRERARCVFRTFTNRRQSSAVVPDRSFLINHYFKSKISKNGFDTGRLSDIIQKSARRNAVSRVVLQPRVPDVATSPGFAEPSPCVSEHHRLGGLAFARRWSCQ
jgi:hypothetical protein